MAAAAIARDAGYHPVEWVVVEERVAAVAVGEVRGVFQAKHDQQPGQCVSGG